jgi:hypothetical protein
MIVVGGFLIGFGSRYAGGCSGHSISGMAMAMPTCCDLLFLHWRTDNGKFHFTIYSITLKFIRYAK